MEAGSIVESAMTAVGIVVMLCSFWFLSVKRMTADLAVIWEITGMMLIVMAVISRVCGWGVGLQGMEEPVLIVLGVAGLFAGYQFSLLISSLLMKNQELAINLSMLQGEDRRHQDREKNLLNILPVKNEEKKDRKSVV